MADPIVIGDTIKALPGTANAKMIGLAGTVINPTGYYSMHDMTTGADYLTPASKKLCLLEVMIGCGVHNTAANVQMYYGTTVNSIVGATNFGGALIRTSTGTNEPSYNAKIYAEIPAANYVTIQVPPNGACFMRGIEIDA